MRKKEILQAQNFSHEPLYLQIDSYNWYDRPILQKVRAKDPQNSSIQTWWLMSLLEFNNDEYK